MGGSQSELRVITSASRGSTSARKNARILAAEVAFSVAVPLHETLRVVHAHDPRVALLGVVGAQLRGASAAFSRSALPSFVRPLNSYV
jgi:hypothetical protein